MVGKKLWSLDILVPLVSLTFDVVETNPIFVGPVGPHFRSRTNF